MMWNRVLYGSCLLLGMTSVSALSLAGTVYTDALPMTTIAASGISEQVGALDVVLLAGLGVAADLQAVKSTRKKADRVKQAVTSKEDVSAKKATTAKQTVPEMPMNNNKDIDFSQIDSDYDIGRFEEALWALQDLQKKYPDDGGVLYRLGLIQEGMLDFNAARKAYKQSAERLSEPSLAYSHLGNLLYKMQQYKSAIGAFKHVMSLKPVSAYASYMLGMVYMDTAQYSESIGSFKHAVEIDASFKQKGLYGQGLSYVRMGNSEKGQALLKEAIVLDPESDVAVLAQKELAEAVRMANVSYLSYFALYGFQYDSNVVLKPSTSPNIPLITGNSDFEHTFLLAFNYAPAPKEGVGYKFSGRFYESLHDRLRIFDITDFGLTWTPYMKLNEQALLFMDASADQILLNYKSYLTTYSLKPTLTYNPNKQLQLMLSVLSRWEYYNLVVSLPNLNQNAWIHTENIQVFAFTEDHRSSAHLGGHRTVNDSRGTDWSYHGYGVDAGFDVAMPYLEKLTFGVHGAAERNDYQNLGVGQTRFRSDTLYDASAILSYPFSYGNVSLLGSYTHNVSTLDVFSYVRMVTGFNISRSF